jgi:hypothetical protein
VGSGGSVGTGGSIVSVGTGGSAVSVGTGGGVGTGGSRAGTGGSSRAGTGGSSRTGTGGSGNPGTGGSGTAGSTGSDGGAGSRASEVCQRWAADRADLSEGTWTGNAAACDAGDIGPPGRANALKLINLYRYLAGLPEVTNDPAQDAMAQQCALMQTANNSLSHTPPTTWKCYTADGAKAAGGSNISSGPGVGSIEAYVNDSGNASTLGHRRWTFSNSLGPVGLGSAKSSCFYNMGGTGKANKPFTAWPPAGAVPLAAITTTRADTSGWSIQSDTINVNTGTVTITDGGQSLAVTTTSLPGGYGSRYAIRMVPSGWTSQAGHSYTVTVAGVTPAVSYTIDVVSCTTP